MTRKLAAILIADVVGFSRLMERDDAGTFSRLREIRTRIVDPKIEEQGGRVVKTAGDGMLLDFGSADAALRCAIEVQRAMRVFNQSKPLEDRIEFRMGINIGDIIVDGTDIAGDGVNVAARLEALAEPGGICVSAAVREQVHGSLDVGFSDIGDQQVKNIMRPIRVFAVDLNDAASMQRVGATHARSVKKAPNRAALLGLTTFVLLGLGGWWAWSHNSALPALPLAIAIMPLSTPSNDTASAALGDTITKNLRVAVGRSIRNAPLVAASRIDAYSDKGADPRAKARALNARYLVDGDARSEAGQVTVTLQLVDGESAAQVWSTQVSLPEAQSVGGASPLINRLTWRLRNAVGDAQTARATAGRATANEPSDLVSRAYAVWADDLASTFAARRLFDAALHIDPNYVPALIGRAWTLNVEFEDDPKSNRDRIVLEMDGLARRATTIDPDNASAWNLLTTALGWQGRYDSALEASARAIRLDPANKSSLINRGWVMDVSGQAQNTPELLAQSRAIDPDAFAYEFNVACEAYVLLGRFTDAAQACAKAAALENWTQNQVWLIAALAQMDDRAAMDTAKKELLRKQPGFTILGFRSQQRSSHPVWVKQAEDNLYVGLRKAGLPEQ
ncbi:MAG: adenylate/guanylate cyclase domain-containing protein [Betaproteobacteria bacterium]